MRLAGLLVFVASMCAWTAAAEDLVIADFEGTDYGNWTVSGEAFGSGPAAGTLPNQQAVSGFLGRGLVNSYLKGDGTQGTLTSPVFRIERQYINFLVGGGAHAGQTCVNLIIDGKVVRSTTGEENERLDWVTWPVADLRDKSARIQIVDANTGGWGHINVDHIVQSDTPRQLPGAPEEVYNERYRPQFHFTARQNWLNDPNGLVHYKGEYHLFFQHNPSGINWGNMTWGHAISTDLVHWEQRQHALYPDRMGTMFSGSAVVDWQNTAGFQTGQENVLVAFYTAAGGTSEESKSQPFTQCIAYSNDRGRTWTKYERNPVLPHIVGGNRDPKVVWHAPSRRWIMALYLDGNTFALFNSPDMKSWTRFQDLVLPECSECPDFFEMPVDGDARNTRWVFTAANGRYLVGTFDGQAFKPQGGGPHRVDFGGNCYAVQTYSDMPERRCVQVAWMNGGKYPRMPFNQQMSFPCAMELRTFDEGIRLVRRPVREIERLRARESAVADRPLKAGEALDTGIKHDLLDIRVEFEVGSAAEVGLRVRGEAIAWKSADRRIFSLGHSAPLALVDGKIRFQVLLDRSSIEVFGNDGRVSMTTCFLPGPDSGSLSAYAAGGDARLVSLKIYELRSAWRKAGE